MSSVMIGAETGHVLPEQNKGKEPPNTKNNIFSIFFTINAVFKNALFTKDKEAVFFVVYQVCFVVSVRVTSPGGAVSALEQPAGPEQSF